MCAFRLKIPTLDTDFARCAIFLSDQELKYVPSHLFSILSTFFLLYEWSKREMVGSPYESAYSCRTFFKLREIRVSSTENSAFFSLPINLKRNRNVLENLRSYPQFLRWTISYLSSCCAAYRLRFRVGHKIQEKLPELGKRCEEYLRTPNIPQLVGGRFIVEGNLNVWLSNYQSLTPAETHISWIVEPNLLPSSFLWTRNFKALYVPELGNTNRYTDVAEVKDWISTFNFGKLSIANNASGNLYSVTTLDGRRIGSSLDGTQVRTPNPIELWRYEQCVRSILGYTWTGSLPPVHIAEFTRYLGGSIEERTCGGKYIFYSQFPSEIKDLVESQKIGGLRIVEAVRNGTFVDAHEHHNDIYVQQGISRFIEGFNPIEEALDIPIDPL